MNIMSLTKASCNPKAIVFLCLTCFFVVPSNAVAVSFDLCYPIVNYNVKVKSVDAQLDPSGRQSVAIKYVAESDVDITTASNVEVYTYISRSKDRIIDDVDEPAILPLISDSHSFCEDTNCPISNGGRFNAGYTLDMPSNAQGTMYLLMRLVDGTSGRELACVGSIPIKTDATKRAASKGILRESDEVLAKFMTCTLSCIKQSYI